MKLGVKIGIGVAAGIVVGFATYKIIYNKRLKDSAESFKGEDKKEYLIDSILILKNQDDSEPNRNFYRAMSLKELENLFNSLNAPPSEQSTYSYADENLAYGYEVQSSNPSAYSTYSE